MKKFFTGVFGLIIGVVMVVVFVNGIKQADEGMKNAKEMQDESLPPIIVDIKDFSKEYSDNQLLADKKYKNKKIETNGYVVYITEGMIQIGSSPQVLISEIYCRTKDDDIFKIKKGDIIKIQGIVDGRNTFGIDIKKCDIML